MFHSLRPFVVDEDFELERVLNVASVSSFDHSVHEALDFLTNMDPNASFLNASGRLGRIAALAVILARNPDNVDFEDQLLLDLLIRCREAFPAYVYDQTCFRLCRAEYFGKKNFRWHALEIVLLDCANFVDMSEAAALEQQIVRMGLIDFVMEDPKSRLSCLRCVLGYGKLETALVVLCKLIPADAEELLLALVRDFKCKKKNKKGFLLSHTLLKGKFLCLEWLWYLEQHLRAKGFRKRFRYTTCFFF